MRDSDLDGKNLNVYNDFGRQCGKIKHRMPRMDFINSVMLLGFNTI